MVIRVCHVISKIAYGGVQNTLFNYSKFVDNKRVIFDYVVYDDGDPNLENDIVKSGSRIHRVSHINNKKKYGKDLEKLFVENEYSIVHVHSNFKNITALRAAKKAKVKTRISHSHSTYKARNVIIKAMRFVFKLLIGFYATHFFGCTEEANIWLHGKRKANSKWSFILNNAVDQNRFLYSEIERTNNREKLSVKDDERLLIHIGTLSENKNQAYIIKILEMAQQHNLKLILVGTGPAETELKDYVENKLIKEKVIFFGNSNNVSGLLSAADVLVFPSIYEGLSLVVVEAQANGIPIVASDTISSNSNITGNITFLPLNEDIKLWIENIRLAKRSTKDIRQKIIEAGYDLESEGARLTSFYLGC